MSNIQAYNPNAPVGSLGQFKWSCELQENIDLVATSLSVAHGGDPADRQLAAKKALADAMTYIDQSPSGAKLLSCSAGSVFQCVAAVAATGLSLLPAFGEAYLVPYGNAATFQAGYKGLLKLADNAIPGVVFRPVLVYEGDDFFYEEGTEPWIKHKPCVEAMGKIDLLKAAYCIAEFPNGRIQICVMNRAQLDKVKGASKMSGGGAWKAWPDQMYLKAVIRRLIKLLPKSGDRLAQENLARLLAHENSQYGATEEQVAGIRRYRAEQRDKINAAVMTTVETVGTVIDAEAISAETHPKKHLTKEETIDALNRRLSEKRSQYLAAGCNGADFYDDAEKNLSDELGRPATHSEILEALTNHRFDFDTADLIPLDIRTQQEGTEQ